jgi:signal transduction histidine kinase
VITLARPHPVQVDWEEWAAPLHQFAQATGLTVSAYDTAGKRTAGPLLASRSARLLGTSTLLAADGPGSAIERRLAAAVVASGAAVPDEQLHGLRVCGLPLTQFGKVYGVLVYGWCFRDFSSPMACEQIGRLVGLSGQALWNEVRLESPMSEARMATNTALLRTLAGSIDRQRETIEQLNRVSRTRDLFLATVSHEMRTPLAALSMRVDLMLKTHPDLPPAVEHGLNAMRVHVRQEAAMVDDLIDAAQTLTGQMSVLRAAVPLGRMVRDALSTIEVNAHQKGIALRVTPADFGDGITIAGDARRLQQVLWNLLLNAIKFTPAGGAIHVDIGVGQRQVRIDVADSGQGIAEADLQHVFGAFTLQKHANATGLGLGRSIARRLSVPS